MCYCQHEKGDYLHVSIKMILCLTLYQLKLYENVEMYSYSQRKINLSMHTYLWVDIRIYSHTGIEAVYPGLLPDTQSIIAINFGKYIKIKHVDNVQLGISF